MAICDPHRIDTPQPITKNLSGNYVGDLYGCVKLGAYPSAGGFWAYGWNITKIIFIYALFEELNYRSDMSTDFHAWWLKRSGLALVCAFLGIFHIAPHLGGQTPKKTILGCEQVFSSQTREIEKLAYYQNYCIDSNQILHSHKDHQMPFVCGPDTY